ncbi:MAG: HD domain-containing protein [Lachnospiraceae bacterium]|nr:HD domain-containing protein [Lachnospiraceae bacterium]
MKRPTEGFITGNLFRLSAAILGVAVNVLLSCLMTRVGLPFYLDTAGTIVVSALYGSFSGIMVAVLTNLIAVYYNPYALYYTLIGILIALYTAWFVHSRRFEKRRLYPLYLIVIALLGAVLGMLFQWALLGGPQFDDVAEIAGILAGGRTGLPFFFSSMLVNLGLNLVDKGVTAGAALVVLLLIPEGTRKKLWDSNWKQKPLAADEVAKINQQARHNKRSLRGRMSLMLILTALALTAVLSVISTNLHFEKTRQEYTENAKHAAAFAASVVDPDRVEAYLSEGRNASGYEETEEMLNRIRTNTNGVDDLYVLRIEDNGCRFLFDLETVEKPLQPGNFKPFEDALSPFLPALKSGSEIEPIEFDDASGWVLTAYSPVRDQHGNTLCYAGAGVSIHYLSGFLRDYLLRTILIFSGFFVLILGYGMWVSGYTLIYPTGSMAASVEELISAGAGQEALDDNVRKLKALDIRTEDEIEKLYRAICQMAEDTAEQLRTLRHYAEATAQMQNGLIITMADMVESRDSDTGAHVQKTAAYVKLILEGLRRKGYYSSKITKKYVTDCVMSAPLHDVGKINIPDAVLNKPGRLTDDEYAIMKTHTTGGKAILERAIDTVQGGSYLKEARNMAAYHHERWDGKGYPEGLPGEVIPLSARVMAVADVFDALASPRVYKPALPFDNAVKIIEEGAGSQFDPKCVEVFLESLDEVKQILKKYDNV